MVLWAGNPWDGLPATDHHLATALAKCVDVLWVDPPKSILVSSTRIPAVREVAEGLQVLQIPTAPAASRSGVRQVTQFHQQAVLQGQLARMKRPVAATISCTARFVMPRRGAGVTVLHVTDDWIAGAPMMGLDAGWITSVLRANVRRVDVLSAVSVDLAQMLQRMGPRRPVEVVPNGATPPAADVMGVERRPSAVLVGQLNERLDIDLLQAVVDEGVPLLILGPRTDRDPAQRARLDSLLRQPGVDWLGPVPREEVTRHLASSSVGLTPYVINDFNRSSFPLKTLEYLAAGLGVVSTPLESLYWLGTDLVDVASTPQEFGQAVRRLADAPQDLELETRRRAFTEQHSWDARVSQLLDLVEARRALPTR